MEGFLFYLGGAMMLLGGVAMVASRSAVSAACWLVLSFLGSAALFAALQAPFLAVLQILVYAGAIMVLFLFVIMMLEGPVMPAEAGRPKFWIPAGALVPAAIILVATARWVPGAGLPGFPGDLPPGFGQPVRVAQLLLGEYLLAFELISIVLVVAIIGALALGSNERTLPWK
ncbi:MAG TPA: NADH-quinone oxidoreductase subunit J [Candidatus Krumholzibacteria bacterium]|nr:NADH-quinone oxidoreductase subunit J [Candidatus Krumholzibacteria bacterium]HPD71421.1 NADH-quinone oxidoreductase subunit J [Candidatus Krumholzibacteria bacterium]HRY41646.1 NADH-quinone oxidoreductase subunit J [Candidatus Krumholzibacteria bacterium]